MLIHLATSEDIGRPIRRALRLPAPYLPDNLLVGPCASSPDVHHEMRARYWGFDGRERTRFLASSQAVMKALASRSRVVLWTSRLWSDVVALWAFCTWRLLLRPLDPKIDLVLVGSASDHGFERGSIRV